MDALEKLEQKAYKVAKLLEYKVKYIPGLIEELDQYQVTHSGIVQCTCYGATEASALNSAYQEVAAQFLENPALIREILGR